MEHFKLFKRAALSLVIPCVFGASVFAHQPAEQVDEAAVWQTDIARGYRSTYIVVKCSKTMPDPRVATSHAFGEQCALWGVSNVRKAYTRDFKHPDIAAKYGMDRTFVLEVPANTDTVTMSNSFKRLLGEVEWAEVDAIGGVSGLVPNDTSFGNQYGMHNTGQSGGVVDSDIDAPEAWEIHTGETNPVIIAVVDSGINSHPEFADRLIPGTNTNNPNTPDLTTDGCPHGTHVAGILAAKGNNGMGVAGVNWGAQLMPVRVVNGCTGTEFQAAAGIEWAADHGADIINMSLQYYTGTQTLNDAIQYAHEAGAVLIAAAGNFQGQIVAFPARFPNCMGVSALNRFNSIANFSNWGPQVDICAAGDDVYSTFINNGYINMDGTSMATPHVAGIAALMKSYNPSLTNTQITQILIDTSVDVGPAGFDNQYGHGRANALAALQAAAPSPIQLIASNPPDGAIDARQPHNIDGSNPVGWTTISLRFNGSVDGVAATDLVVIQEGGTGVPPTIMSITQILDDTINVELSGPINVGAWTKVMHQPSGSSTRIGYLPADVNGDGTSSPVDILAVIDSLNGVGPALPLSATDLNRSGAAEPSDILREIDLLNGADAFEVYNGVSLP